MNFRNGSNGSKIISYQFISIRNRPFELSVHVLLELFHVEDLERFVGLQNAVRHLQDDVVRDGALLGHVANPDSRGAAQTFDLEYSNKKLVNLFFPGIFKTNVFFRISACIYFV